MAVTFETMADLYHSTPAWTRSVRQFRMAWTTKDELIRNAPWEHPHEFFFGHLVVVDNAVPHGTVHFEIHVPEPKRGLA